MKTLTFTDEEIELLCRGVLALQDNEADLGPLIALHAKLTGTGYVSFAKLVRDVGRRTILDLQMERLREQIGDKIDPGPVTVDGQLLRQVLARKEVV